jgi:hypothetical protein
MTRPGRFAAIIANAKRSGIGVADKTERHVGSGLWARQTQSHWHGCRQRSLVGRTA